MAAQTPIGRVSGTEDGTPIIRCGWSSTEAYHAYHDNEWGRPLHDDARLFEMLCLEGMQAGLSWLTVLNKRDNFRKAFDNFDAEKIVKYDDKKVAALLQDAGIIRNKLKVNAVIVNARAYLEIRRTHGSFDAFIWGYMDGAPLVNHWKALADVPASTPLSDKISKDLKKLGFKFIGTTIVYAYMQAVGMVNDHLTTCFLYEK